MFEPHSPLGLEDGRNIRLTQLWREETYLHWMEGWPGRRHNLEVLQKAGSRATGLFGDCTRQTPPLLLPTRVQVRPREDWVAWDLNSDPTTTDRNHREFLPPVLSVGLFISGPLRDDPEDGDASFLAVAWFQQDPHQFMEEEPLAHLQKVPWDSLASSWRW